MLVPTGELLGRLIGSAVRIGLLFYCRRWSRHRVWPAGQLDCQGGAARRRSGGELRALGAGLYSVGIRKNRIVEYETGLKSDKFLLVAHGTADEMARANSILMTRQ